MTAARGGGPTRPNGPSRRALPWRGIALVCWVLFIWGHSLVPGPGSTAESDAVARLVTSLVPSLEAVDAHLVTFVIRKGAHLSEYAVLGALASSWASARGIGATPRSLLALCAVPLVDECVQLLVPGRTGQPLDVLIDVTGIAVGCALIALARRARAGRRGSRGA
ncbi:VanZ family protein [Thermophilibacter mediterraneus]|uniref:VanZ family protein n=1 Tax=Thermophilibacter mediterraneus TaxID=1871031 RepID=UPI0009306DFA|nr:VanZ family protein [Thermophilibacter mediterraneus]